MTGAIPIRRNTKDPAYLVTLKAYVAELLQRHDLLFYFEGGRSYSGELKAPKTGLLHATLQATCRTRSIVPMAVAYDVVLEDHILAHQAGKGRGRPFAREIAEMVRYAVGYQSRAFVTFGEPISLDGFDPEARRDVMALAHLTRDAVGRLYKVLPTAVLAAALKPSITRRELEARADAIIETVARPAATWASPPDVRRSRKGPSRCRRATSSTWNAADASACANAPCCATTHAPFSISSPERSARRRLH